MYRHAPSCGTEQFKLHILDFENTSKRRIDRNDKITEADASEIFSHLRRYSKRAEREGHIKDICIVYDWKTQHWRGFETNPPDASLGIERKTKRHEQLKDSHRRKLGDILPCSREEMIETICHRYKCDSERAEEVFATCRTNDIFIYHKPTRTWRGCYCDEMPTEKVSAPITSKQDSYLDRYGKMPPLMHDFRKRDQSPALKWIAQIDSVTMDEAERRYKRIWNVSRDHEKTALIKDHETGLVCGRNYVAPRNTSIIESLSCANLISEAKNII